MLNEEFIVGLVAVMWCTAQKVVMPGLGVCWYKYVWGDDVQWGCGGVIGAVSGVVRRYVVVSVGALWWSGVSLIQGYWVGVW